MIQLLLVDNNQHNEKRRDKAGLEEAIRRRPLVPKDCKEKTGCLLSSQSLETRKQFGKQNYETINSCRIPSQKGEEDQAGTDSL